MEEQSYYYLYNAHGDVTALIDAKGNIAATYAYDAFGNIISETGNADNYIKYAGYQHDDESGLYYLNARYYDSTIARFITEDSYRGQWNDPLSLKLYTYCVNNPIIYIDPTGHRTLKKGCNGNDVKNMQTKLIELGYDLGPDGADGKFGTDTDKAVKQYQEDYKLKIDGKVGPQTTASLGQTYSAYRASLPPKADSKKNNENTKKESNDPESKSNNIIPGIPSNVPINTIKDSIKDELIAGNQSINQFTAINYDGEIYVTADQLRSMGFNDCSEQSVMELNYTLNLYGITETTEIQLFLGTCLYEAGTDYDKDRIENNSKNYKESGYQYFTYRCFYKDENKDYIIGSINPDKLKFWGYEKKIDTYKYVGAGYIQLSGDYNYKGFQAEMAKMGIDDKNITAIGATHVAANYPWLSSGYWWNANKMNSLIENENLDILQVSRAVNGGPSRRNDESFTPGHMYGGGWSKYYAFHKSCPNIWAVNFESRCINCFLICLKLNLLI